MAAPTVTTRGAVILHGRQHYWHRFAVKGTDLDSVSSIAVVAGSSTYNYDLDYEKVNDTGSGHVNHVLVVKIKRRGGTFSGGSARLNPGDTDNLTYTVTNSGGSVNAQADIVYD